MFFDFTFFLRFLEFFLFLEFYEFLINIFFSLFFEFSSFFFLFSFSWYSVTFLEFSLILVLDYFDCIWLYLIFLLFLVFWISINFLNISIRLIFFRFFFRDYFDCSDCSVIYPNVEDFSSDFITEENEDRVLRFLFFIRTSKFRPRLGLLKFCSFSRLKCSWNVLFFLLAKYLRLYLFLICS